MVKPATLKTFTWVMAVVGSGGRRACIFTRFGTTFPIEDVVVNATDCVTGAATIVVKHALLKTFTWVMAVAGSGGRKISVGIGGRSASIRIGGILT